MYAFNNYFWDYDVVSVEVLSAAGL